MKSIAAVVVTYNRKHLLEECVNALLKQEQVSSFDILIIDNGSTDGTKDMICRFESDLIKYFNTGKNLGGAGGFNYGIKIGVKYGYSHLWVMDDDTIPDGKALYQFKMVDLKLKGKYGILSSFAYWKDGSPCQMNYQSIDLEQFWRNVSIIPQLGIIPINKASFVSCIIPTDIIKDVGLPIKEFFIWMDDVEYTSRIAKKYPCYFVPNSKVLHKMSKNNQALISTDSIDRMKRYEYKYRNLYYIHYRDKKIKKYYFILFTSLISILRTHNDYKLKRIFAMLRGWIKGIKFHPNEELIKIDNGW